MNITKKMMGLIKSPKDPRDYLAAPFLAPEVLTLPDRFDLTDKMTPVLNQGNEGSCVGFAMSVGVKEYQEQKEHGAFIALSPRYVYERAKSISGHREGTTLKAAMQVVHTQGVCEEEFWPYTPGIPGIPNPGTEESAAKYKIKSYARVRNLEELKRAVCDPLVGATMIGVMVYKGMVGAAAQKTGVVPDPTCWDRRSPLGGHAICVVGFDNNSPYFKNDGHVKAKNSWSTGYGDKGYMYLSYKNINRNMLDCYACVDIVDDTKIQRIGYRKEWER